MVESTSAVFKRTALAGQFARKILSVDPGSAAGSGLFLAAPRRTGKSTFLREDLRPQLEAQNALVLYVDLWADLKADPGAVVVSAVRAELGRHQGVIARLAKAIGMEEATVGGIAFSLDRVGLGADISLSAALAMLSDEVEKCIVLVIDEAQHAITTENGYSALFALKAARNELNSSRHHGLRIVGAGSNRDKLAMLRNSREQPFFGAPLVAFPLLGDDYVAWFCNGVDLPAPLDQVVVGECFEQAGFRPEILGAAADALRFDFDLKASQVPERFLMAVEEQIAASDEQALRAIRALTPLQSAVLRVLAARAESYAPFEATTIAAYQAVLDALDTKTRTITAEVPNVQQALAALQEKSLVWREQRGVYALEENTLRELMRSKGLLDLVPPIPTPAKGSAASRSLR